VSSACPGAPSWPSSGSSRKLMRGWPIACCQSQDKTRAQAASQGGNRSREGCVVGGSAGQGAGRWRENTAPADRDAEHTRGGVLESISQGARTGLGRLAEFLGQMEGCLAGGESPRYGYLTPSSTGPRPGGCWLSQSDPGVWLGCPGCGCAGLAERWGPVVSRCVLGWCQLSKAFHLGCPQLCPFFAGILCPRMLPHP